MPRLHSPRSVSRRRISPCLTLPSSSLILRSFTRGAAMRRHLSPLLLVLIAGCSRPDDELRIVFFPKGLTHEHWQSVHRGALRAAADLEREQGLKVRIIWDGPRRVREALAQIRIVDRRVSTRVDGVVLAPQHSETMCGPVERARKQGIPVVILDSGLKDPALYDKYVATDNFHGGYLAADHLLKVLAAEKRPRNKIIMLRYQVGSESTEQREDG